MPYLSRKHQLGNSLVYHLFNRGNFRLEIFHDSEDYQYFVKLLSNYSKEHNFSLYHWVLMPNHYHLLLEIEEPEKLSSVMSGLARAYVYYHHKKYQLSGHLWQGRFKSQAVEKDLYLLACGRYIERNPVQAKMAEAAEDYPYSSAGYYVFGKDDGLTKKNPLFADSFGSRDKYREFLMAFAPEEERPFESLEFPQGSKEFLKRLVKDKGLFLPRRRGRIRK